MTIELKYVKKQSLPDEKICQKNALTMGHAFIKGDSIFEYQQTNKQQTKKEIDKNFRFENWVKN